MKLSYLDEDNDQLDILSTDDFKVAVENATKRNINLKVKVDIVNPVEIEEIESEEEQEQESQQAFIPPFIEELKRSILDLKLDDEPVIVDEPVFKEYKDEDLYDQDEPKEEIKEEPKEPLREFRFADLFEKVENVINTGEDVKPCDIFFAV